MDLVNFDRSLKITWVKKLENGLTDWTEFARFYKMDRLIWSGEKYHQFLIDNTPNPFWKSVAISYKEWFKSLLQTPYYPTEFQPIWGNTHINIPFNAPLYRNGLIFVGDLLDTNGQPLSIDALRDKYDCQIMFTVYCQTSKI